MRICYFYSKYIPEAIDALPFFDVDMIFTGDSETGYWEAVRERWRTDDLLFIEHDIVCRTDIPGQLDSCMEPWCTYPYNGLKSSLGCTRFRKEIPVTAEQIQSAPMAVWPIPGLMVHARFGCKPCEKSICWRHLDLKIASALMTRGHMPHVHWPDVRHIK